MGCRRVPAPQTFANYFVSVGRRQGRHSVAYRFGCGKRLGCVRGTLSVMSPGATDHMGNTVSRRCVVMGSLAHAGPAITAAFLASLVEAVEALTIVLAVATVRGWRPAGLDALAGLLFLVLIVVALGPLLDR